MYIVLLYHHVGDRSDDTVDRLQPHFETDSVSLYHNFKTLNTAQKKVNSLRNELVKKGWTPIDEKSSTTQDFYLYGGINEFSGLPEYYEIRLIYVG